MSCFEPLFGARMTGLLMLVWLATAGGNVIIEQDNPCPEQCECHHFRVNWVTDCSQSGLTTIPRSDLSLNTYVLDLSCNKINHIGPFADGLKVRDLRLSNNYIQNITREAFCKLTHLIELDLSYNDITRMNTLAFQMNTGLIKVNLEGNPLCLCGGPLLVSRSIRYLSLNNCSLNRGLWLKPEVFIGLEGLLRLDLSNNALDEVTGILLHPLGRLQYLKMNNCKLTSITGHALNTLEDLKELELKDNPSLTYIAEWLPPLSQLEKLDLRGCGLSQIEEDPFNNNTWLTSVVLSGNPLGPNLTLSDGLDLLESLDLSGCGLEEIEAHGQGLFRATRLRDLDLSDNQVPTEQLADLLRPLTRLRSLVLRNCSLEELPDYDTFSNLTELRELDLSHNPLEKALTGSLGSLRSLIRLDMSYCGIKKLVEATFHNMTSLETLILAGNPLVALEPGLFSGLEHLKVLDLSSCGLRRLKSTVFPDNFSALGLAELRLANNPLAVEEDDSFLPQRLAGLSLLDLTSCGISKIPAWALSNFGNLTTLLLSGNLLYGDEGQLEFLQHLPLLEELDLSSNRFTSLDPFELRFNNELKTVRLAGNPWTCGCHVADTWDWALTLRGDLSILPGSTLSNRDGEPKKKSLVCRLEEGDDETGKNVSTISWWRFVRSSDCESSRRPQAMSQKGTEGEAKEDGDVWWWLVLLAMFAITSVTLVVRRGPACWRFTHS